MEDIDSLRSFFLFLVSPIMFVSFWILSFDPEFYKPSLSSCFLSSIKVVLQFWLPFVYVGHFPSGGTWTPVVSETSGVGTVSARESVVSTWSVVTVSVLHRRGDEKEGLERDRGGYPFLVVLGRLFSGRRSGSYISLTSTSLFLDLWLFVIACVGKNVKTLVHLL